MKVLVTGASGLLGRAVHAAFSQDAGHSVTGLSFTRTSDKLTQLDLLDTEAVSAFLTSLSPDVIVHCAAERRPDAVERDPQGSHSLNVEVPGTLARLASTLPSQPLLIALSTDYVFDGSKPPYKVHDEPNPLNAYGVSKLQGERSVASHGAAGRFTNLRVPVLYGVTEKNTESAVNCLLDAISPPIKSAKCDAYGVRYPTFVGDVAKAITRMAEKQELPPITHFSAKEAMTKYDMCLVISRVANAAGFETRTDHLEPEYEVDPLAATARPRHCKMDTSVLQDLGVPIEHVGFEEWWRDYLKEKMQEKKKEDERIAKEAEAKRLKEEEEARKKQAEEEEEARKAEEQQRKDEANQQAKEPQALGEVDPAAPTEPSSPRQDQPGSSPQGSPNPSFSSLRGRPTPPATSGLPSPTSSAPPSSLRRQSRDETAAQGITPSASTTAVEAKDGVESPLSLENAARGATVAPPARISSLTDEQALFGGKALDIAGKGDSDGDSDGYGQPSPRNQAPPEAPPTLYHRDSFDAAQRTREIEAHESATVPRNTFTIKVGDPQKVGDPMTAHIVYTVRTWTDSPLFRGSTFSVLRRYRDFRWLHAALVHNNPGVIVPPVPEKVALGRFAAELVEARRIGLEVCINKIAAHPLLQADEDFKLFLESDNFAVDVKQRDLIKGPIVTPEQKTWGLWSTRETHKFVETDEWFEEQKVYLDGLESSLKGVVKGISGVSAARKELEAGVKEVAGVFTTLSGSSLSRSLSTCFAGLAEVERRVAELEEMQAEADVRQVGTVMYEYERVVGSVRKAFQTRVETWQSWQKLEDDHRRARSRYEKAKRDSASNSHFHALLSEVSETESKSLEKKRLFDLVSTRCKSEMERLDEERVDDFIKALEGWVDGMVERQREVVAEWEGYLALLGRQMGVNAEVAAA